MWKADDVNLPKNRTSALKRLYALERRFHRDPEFATKYDAVVQEYITLKHARLLTTQEARKETNKTWYLPHHGVMSPSSSSTKVRVVFDGAAEYGETSINKNLLRGPNLLVSLLGVLVRFRRNLIPVGADIEKMFHQVQVPEEDQAAYRFVYRTPGSSSAPLTYQMTVHVFGSISSPTTCIYALNRTADDYHDQFPEAADSVRRSFYVDNYLDSFDSEDEVIKRARQMKNLLDLGGFNLTKWTSSSRNVMTALREYGLASPTLNLDLDKLPIERTLGVMWDGERDMLTFKINKSSSPVTVTKRRFLSIISSVYDPLGLVAPVVFLMKSLLQEIWTCEPRIGWDDPLPEELHYQFLQWYEHLGCLEWLAIPRCYRIQPGSCTQQLHVFTDASSKGFGAVAYFRTTYEHHVDVSFVMSKTHVTPVKGLTIPRLELQAAVEGLHIALIICRELELDLREVTFHTDSQTVLRWIYSRTCKFEVFVNNRVGKILRNTSRRQWRHVAGVDNPADLCSRGIEPQNVEDLNQFHRGPSFLKIDQSEWTTWEEITEPEESDVNVIRVLAVQTQNDNHTVDQIVNKNTSLLRIQRIMAWVRRFAKNARANQSGDKPTVGELTMLEMSTSLELCIKRSQELAFNEEIYALRKNLELPLKSKLRPFKPFFDDSGQLRVGGRIIHAPVDYSAKHPILLPADQLITQRIVWNYHVTNLHVKAETLLAGLRSHYWILSGRKVIKSVVNNCWPCKRRSAKPIPPLMASLPVHRLTPSRPAFNFTGIDYFGPLTVRVGGRGRRHEKRWISLFTCLTTRAVHLEVSDGLNLEEFLLCFTRFTSLRGKPEVIYSDNGTNLVAAEQELRQALEELTARFPELQTKMACLKIDWHFSPPYGPHFGGVWERLVQSCKRAMKISISTRLVTDRVLRTVIAEVAALLNSRPLTHLSMDPDDPEPLTPNHFLHGGARPYQALKWSEEKNVDVTAKQFLQSQAIIQHFWKRWLIEYVPHLTERRKWVENRPNITVGDLVLVIEPNTLRGQWPLGKVIEVMPSETDNVVRVVKVKISSHKNPCVRPITKLCVIATSKEQKVHVKSEL